MIIPHNLDNRIRERARYHCEYCQLAPTATEPAFVVGHITPPQEDAVLDEDNLALFCTHCAQQQALADSAELFNPRRQVWREHFQWKGELLVGVTLTGRLTVETLNLNAADLLEKRLKR